MPFGTPSDALWEAPANLSESRSGPPQDALQCPSGGPHEPLREPLRTRSGPAQDPLRDLWVPWAPL
eukprot:1178833-Prorocentrum_minimum.AAC.3